MAGERYVFTCVCGYEAPVRATAAGTAWKCQQCGKEALLPDFREITRRQAVAESAVPPALFQFNLKCLFVLMAIVGGYLAFVKAWGFWQVTFFFAALAIYGTIQGLLLFRGSDLVAYCNALAFIVTVLLLPLPCWLLGQREEGKRLEAHKNLRSLGLQTIEKEMFHGRRPD